MLLRSMLVLPLLVLPACTAQPPAEDNTAVIANATENYEDTVRAADDRADRLDDLAEDLEHRADRTGGGNGQALRAESESDFADAAAIRARGRRDAIRAEDAIENQAGLLNGQ